MYRHILVAVDGSECSALALQQAETLARTFDARLTLLHAYPGTADIVGSSDYSIAIAKRKAEGQEVLDAMLAKLGGSGLTVESRLAAGPEAEAVLKAVKEQGADLVVMGSRGLGRVKGILLGSVSRDVCLQAPCSVLVVK